MEIQFVNFSNLATLLSDHKINEFITIKIYKLFYHSKNIIQYYSIFYIFYWPNIGENLGERNFHRIKTDQNKIGLNTNLNLLTMLLVSFQFIKSNDFLIMTLR